MELIFFKDDYKENKFTFNYYNQKNFNLYSTQTLFIS